MPVPLSTERVQRTLRKDEVFDRLFSAILDGTLEPGERIRDGDLQTWLGTSRTPIRLALDRLEALLLVESVPNCYTRVSPIGPERVQPLLEVLCTLWSLAVRLAVVELDGQNEPECRRLLGDARQACLDHRGPDASVTVERLSGALLYFTEYAGNDLLQNLVIRAGAPFRFQLAPQGDGLDVRLLAHFFTRLDAAVVSRDPNAAAEAVAFLRSNSRELCRSTPKTGARR